MDITVGTIVYSKAGHDKGNLFMTLSVEGGYALIADGKTRRIEKPKRKKLIHLQRTNKIIELSSLELSNSRVRKIIAEYNSL